MTDIKKITSRLEDFFKAKKNIIAVYLYGSYAKGKATKKSDIDFAILFKSRYNRRFMTDQEINLATEIQKIIKEIEVEVKILNSAPLFFQYKVISSGRLIFCSDYLERIEYESDLMSRYFDFKPLLDYYNKCMFKNIKEGYYGPGLRIDK